MHRARHSISSLACLVVLLTASKAARADEADELKKAPPQITHAAPLALMPGSTVTLHLRGTNLEEASAVRFPEVKDGKSAPQAVIKSKGAATAPKLLEAKTFGNS